MIPSNVYNFMFWIKRNTLNVQSNVVRYKNNMYFTDRRKAGGGDGGLDDLWDIYVKEVLG